MKFFEALGNMAEYQTFNASLENTVLKNIGHAMTIIWLNTKLRNKNELCNSFKFVIPFSFFSPLFGMPKPIRNNRVATEI